MESFAVERLGLAQDALRGRVAVVTGAGRGIGREIARAFAWLGARVVVAEIQESGAETERLILEAGGEACFIPVDVSDEQSVLQLARQTEKVFGSADMVINNAILCPVKSVLEMPVDLWDRVMAVNLRGTFLMSKAFLPAMIGKKGGTIINMISADAIPYLSAYIASKRGIEAFSQSLAGEVGAAGVWVIALAIGMVDTPAIREVATNLAPTMGLTPEQFLHMSLHPTYEGLMPADHAAAAVAYLTARLAEHYQGETVTGYEVLEMAGFLVKSTAMPVETGSAPKGLETAQTKYRDLAQGFAKMIAATDGELNQLPIFVRPLARRGFKSKTGKSMQEWQQAARQIGEEMTAFPPSRSALQVLREPLQQLIGYYRDVPAETARFTKDRDLLREVQRVSDERISLIKLLLENFNIIGRS